MKDAYQNEFQKEKKMLSLLFAICMIWFVGKFFIFFCEQVETYSRKSMFYHNL